ncbi:zona pellucida sperm-binding protein 3-like isoform X2 [Hippoglossus hippoglossus]|uniref:zona pellucida sperm-binding protein 3-like isoform X2 n=1 Tax=Hippoglossus hippoglossus TaxID=8267 RepID=UPI00148D017C|nr:zona pellucida sperm-binding protein 3-like isoform X2 [Hippoglossus hippoglossus]
MRLQPSVANHAACVKMAVLLQFTGLHLDFLAVALSVSASSFAMGTRDSSRLEIRCGEAEVRVTVQRRLLEERRVPFRREHLRLGAKPTRGQEASCGPRGLMTGEAAVISAGLRDCGAESRVHGEWLVYSNQLFLFPAVISTSSGSVIVRAATTIIPVECHYNRKQTVNADALTPTWQPMTSTIGVFGLLHFSLRTMADDCNSLRSSSVYQQGEAVFLEASVEAPLHPLLTVCLVDSVLPGSSSKFLLREQENRLCFSVQAFHFKQDSGEQMFISCHLRATPKPNSQSHLNKACFFHRPTFRWRATEGDQALCECCDSDDCLRQTGVGNIGYTVHTTPPHKETTHEADTTVGPLHTLPPSHWTGHLSVSH